MSAAWIAYLLSEQRSQPPPYPHPNDLSPNAFVSALFRAVAEQPTGITRHGLDAMMDVLFALPEMVDLLRQPKESQNEVTEALDLANLPAAFQAQWTHIIVPAWDQHAEIRKLLDATQP